MLLHRRLVLGLAAAASITAFSAVGCTVTQKEEPTSALDDALTAEDFDTVVRELGSLPWLPWTYLTDGCYARALYYSMLLASKNVPTNHLYSVAKPGTTLMGIWSWHVAPLVTKNKDPNHLYVLDPAYDQTKALTNIEWLANQNWPDPAAPKYPTLHLHSGNSYLDQFNVEETIVNPASPVASDYAEPAINEMPAFAMTDVSAACVRMHMYIDRETTTTTEQKADKHKNLARETQKLVAVLGPKGKLDGPTTLPAQCTRGEVIDGASSTSSSSGATSSTSGATSSTSSTGGSTSGSTSSSTGGSTSGSTTDDANFVEPTRVPAPQ